MLKHACTRNRHDPRMHESTAKETGVGKPKKKSFESGDLGPDNEGTDWRRIKQSAGRPDLEVEEVRDDPEPRLRCRRRRPGRATGKHQEKREGTVTHRL